MEHARRSGLAPILTAAARRHGLRPELLLAVASRESHIGQMPPLAPDWTGDRGHGRGVLQVDDRWHSEFTSRTRNDDHLAHADYGAALLARFVRQYGGDVRKGLAAYNSGPGNVNRAIRERRSPEHYTTGRDYATDTLARAQVIARLSGGGTATAGVNWGATAAVAGAVAFILDPTFGALTGVSMGLLAKAQADGLIS